MRVQNISLNNQPQRSQKSKNQNPAFNANLYGKFSTTCKKGEMCLSAKLIKMLETVEKITEAVKAEKMKLENFLTFELKNGENTKGIVVIDKTTKLGKSLMEDPSKENMEKILKDIDNDPETEIISIEKLKQCE